MSGESSLLRVPFAGLTAGDLVLPAASARYVARVHRRTVGDRVLLVDHAASQEATAVVTRVDPDVGVHASALRPVVLVQPYRITVLQALGKADKIDQIARDLTEIGAHRLIPMSTRRTVVKLLGKEEAKLERWRRVVIEASRQAGRPDTLRIDAVLPFARAVQETEGDVRLLLAPLAAARLSDVVIPAGATVVIAIGPEGGFHEEEVRLAAALGFQTVTTGDTVLRTETAGPAVVAALLYR